MQPYLCTLYSAIFVSAYFGLLRIGELTESQHVIKSRNVHMGQNKQKILFILTTSKTHWLDSKPQLVKISSSIKMQSTYHSANLHVCPFKLIKKFIKHRPVAESNDEQFFVFQDNSPVKPAQTRKVLKELLNEAGLNSQLYTFHGFRSGRASDLLSLNLSVETMKKLGRWRSSAVYTYLR